MASEAVLSLLIALKDEASAGLSAIGGGLTSMAGLAAAGGVALTGAVVGVGAAAFDMAADVAQSANDMQASLGVTAERAQELANLGEDIWANNWGSGIEEVNAALAETQRQFAGLGGIADSEAQSIVQSAFAISDSFGVDVNEAISAQKTLMEQFGLTAQQASDMVAKGFQSGLNSSDDFLDTIGEYSNLFAAGGADAAQFFSLIESGMGSGVLGTDKAADAFKEFGIRIREVPDTLFGKDGALLNTLGMTTDEVDKLFNGLQDGSVSVADAFGMIMPKLQGMENEVWKNTAGVALFGTQWEDLGPVIAANMSMGTTSLNDMAGATDSLNAKYNNWGSLWEGVKRQALDALQPAATAALQLANEAMPLIGAALPAIVAGFVSFSSFLMSTASAIGSAFSAVSTFLAPVAAFLQANLMPILAGIGTVLAGMLVPALISLGTYAAFAAPIVLGLFAGWAVGAASAALATLAAAAPLLLVGAAVALLFAAWQNNWFGIRDIVANVWAYLQPILSQLIVWFQTNIPIAIAAAVATFNTIAAAVSSAGASIQAGFGAAIAWLQGAWTSVSTNASAAWTSITTSVSTAGLAIQAAFLTTLAWLAASWASVQESASAAWVSITGTATVVATTIQTAFAVTVAWLAGAWAAIAGAASAAWASVTGVVMGAVGAVVGVIQTGMGIINTIMLAVGNTIIYLGTWAFQGLLALISPVIAAIVAVVGPPIEYMVGNLIANFQWAFSVATTVWAAISSAVSTAAIAIVSALTSAGAAISGALASAWAAVSAGASAAWATITGVVSAGAAQVTALATAAGAAISGALASAWAAVSAGASAAWATITGAVSAGATAVAGLATSAGAMISGSLSAAWAAVSAGASAAWATITGAISTAIAAVVSVLAAGWANVLANVTSVWTQVKTAIDTAITGIKTTIQAGVEIAKTIVTTAWAVIVAASQNNFGQIPQIISSAWEHIKAVFSNGVAAAKATLLGFVGDAVSIGGYIVDGILRGLSGAAGRLAKAAGDMARGALAAVAGVLKIGSPSRAFAQLGAYSTEGFGVGFVAAIPKVTTNLVNGVSGLMEKVASAVENGSKALAAVSGFQGSSGSGLSGFLAGIKDMAIQFNDAAVALGGRILGTATRFADTIGKVTAPIDTALKALGGLVDFVAPARANISAFIASMYVLLNALNNMAAMFESKAIKAAATFAEGAGKMLAVVGPAIDALKKLPDLVVPAQSQVNAFGESLFLIVRELLNVAALFAAQSLQAGAAFGEAGAKLLGVVAPAIDALKKLPELVAPADGALATFGDALGRTVQALIQVASLFAQDAVDAAAKFAEGAGKAIGIVGTSVDSFTKLATFTGISQAAIDAFGAGLRMVLARLLSISSLFSREAIAAAGVFGEGAGKAISALGAGIDTLGKLVTFVAPAEANVSAFFQSIADLLEKMGSWAGGFEADMLDATAVFSTGIQKSVVGIGAAVDALSKIVTFVAPAEQNVSAFFRSLADLLEKMGSWSANFEVDMLEATAAFSAGVQKSVAGIGAAVDALGKLVDFTAPAEKHVSAFFLALADLLERMGSWAGNFEADMLASTATFAAGVSQSVAPLKGAIDSLSSFADFVPPAQKAVGAFFAALVGVLQQIQQVSALFGAEAVASAAAFATNVATVVGQLKGALQAFASLGDTSVKPAVLGAFMQAAQSLIAQMAAYLPPNAEVIGSNTIVGLINGIVGQRSNLIAAMTNTVLAAVQAAQATLGIASPSKVFEQLGQYTGQGMAGGMNAMQPAVASAGAGLGMAAVGGASGGVGSSRSGGAAGPINITFAAGAIAINGVQGGLNDKHLKTLAGYIKEDIGADMRGR